MAGITRLLVILEEDNRIKLELPNGIPSSVDKVIQKIKTVCGLPNEIRLQYYDADFGTWVNLTSTSELKDLASLKVIHVEPPVTLFFDPVDMSADKGNFHSQDDSCISASLDDLLPASSHSSNTYRKEQWPKRCRLERSGRDTHTDTPGSFNHSYGWKQRLKTKMYNYRTYLKSHSSSSDELTVNTMKRKSPMDAHPAKNIKKPRRAESNHYPSLPLNETPESMEQERIALLSEVKKKNNVKTIREKMAQTFAFIRQEIVDKKTSLLSIIERWPGLLEVQEDTDVAVKREIALKSITVYMGEEVEDLIKDFLVSEKEEAEQVLQQETIAIVKRVKRF
ncbi:sterile alpha motif domain-containing protein 3-like [Pimephales promelas]|nr:sterile alpha motif domain-containing protein 3-like [Pimephales promelas]